MAERRYKAFISYSHRDKQIASWLHRALETYRLPKPDAGGKTPERLHPIFKDREELPAADSLGTAIEKAIAASEALVVLCSPAAANSPWIAREIDLFKRLHGDRNVFPVIVSGEPPANFPAPLLVHYENGEPTERKAEPIAADLRPEADGKRLAKLKLIAGLAGVELDALVRRDAARRQRRLVTVAVASLVGMVGTSGLALYAIEQRDEAREQRAEADGLIEYMLTDLRQQLEPVGRLEVLDGVGRRAMDYYARQKLEDLSDTELGRRVRATQLVAEVQNLRGNNAAALPAFRQAARTTEALLARDPDDPERLYNHGQSLFWVGYVAWQHGKMAEARTAMEAYAEVSNRLAAMDRANLEWQMEEAYSLGNLGTIDFEEGKLNSALAFFSRSLRLTDRVSEAEGRPIARQIEVGEGSSWVATTLHHMGRVPESIAVRQGEIDLYEAVLARDPKNNDARRGRMYAHSAMARLLMLTGKRREARDYLDRSIDEAEAQIAADPENTYSRELVRGALRDRALLAWHGGDLRQASSDYERGERLLRELRRRDPQNTQWNVDDPAAVDLQRALTDRSAQDPEALMRLASGWSAKLTPGNPETHWMRVAALLVAGIAKERMGSTQEARQAYAQAATLQAPSGERFDFAAIALQAVAAERAGDASTARKLRNSLRERGVDPLIDDRIAKRS